MSLTVPIVKWLERHAGKQGIACSIPSGGTCFNFEFSAYFSLLTDKLRPFKLNQVMAFIQSNGCTEIDLILRKYGGDLYDDMSDLTYEPRHAKRALSVILIKMFIFVFSECISL